MLIDFNQELVDYNGEIMKLKEAGKDNKPCTLAWACCGALISNMPNDKGTGDDKKKRFFLAQKIDSSVKLVKGKINITEDELIILKDRIGVVWGTSVVGAVCTLFDSGEVKKEAAK